MQLSREMEDVLTDKTEGSSATKVGMAEGNGLKPYEKLFKWFAQTSGPMTQEEVKHPKQSQ